MPDRVEGFEGFDEMAIADVFLRYGGGSTNCSVQNAITLMGMPEGQCLRIGNGGSLNVAVPADDEYYVGFHWSPRQGSSSGTVLQLREGTTEHGRLAINADGTFTISRAGSIPATSAAVGPFLLGITHHLQVRYKVHDSTGALEVRLDGTAIIGPTGSFDTRNAGTSGIIDNLVLPGGTSWTVDVDNLWWASGSAGFQGECRVVTDVPVSDGANTAWTPSTGSRWACVDEIPQNGDTDYISTASAAARSSFGMATFGLTGTIRAVAVAIFGRKDDAGTRQVRSHIRQGGTDYEGAATWTLSTSQAGYQEVWTADPATGTTWADSAIDTAEYGVYGV